MRKYDILLWDVDDTLLDFEKSADYALRKTFEQYGLKLTDEMVERYMEINQSYWKRLETGEVDRLTVLRNRFSDLFEQYGITGIGVDAFRSVYQVLLGSVCFYLEESDRLLDRLRGAGVRQYLVTNGVASTQRNKLKLSGLDRLTDGLFISEEVGAVKPDRAFFDACFARIPDFDRERTLLIGDSYSSDIQGAFNAGVASCLYCPGNEAAEGRPKPDYRIGSLWEIGDLIGVGDIRQ